MIYLESEMLLDIIFYESCLYHNLQIKTCNCGYFYDEHLQDKHFKDCVFHFSYTFVCFFHHNRKPCYAICSYILIVITLQTCRPAQNFHHDLDRKLEEVKKRGRMTNSLPKKTHANDRWRTVYEISWLKTSSLLYNFKGKAYTGRFQLGLQNNTQVQQLHINFLLTNQIALFWACSQSAAEKVGCFGCC